VKVTKFSIGNLKLRYVSPSKTVTFFNITEFEDFFRKIACVYCGNRKAPVNSYDMQNVREMVCIIATVIERTNNLGVDGKIILKWMLKK
jgi:hypothetical protein